MGMKIPSTPLGRAGKLVSLVPLLSGIGAQASQVQCERAMGNRQLEDNLLGKLSPSNIPVGGVTAW